MNASDTSPTEGHECDGASDLEQSVLREVIQANTQLVADELRESRGDDLRDQLENVRRAKANLSVLETLIEEYVEEEP